MPETKNDARLNFRINSELKKTIEDAAAQTGQTVSDFAVSTLLQASRKNSDGRAGHSPYRPRSPTIR